MRTPSVAINECVSMANGMADLTHHNLELSVMQLHEYSADREAEILANEDNLDIYEDKLGHYLIEISQQSVSAEDGREVSRLLHCIGDFERIGDHAVNLQESARELHDKELQFSEAAKKELEVLTEALADIQAMAFDCFRRNDPEAAGHVEPLEQTIDQLIEEIRLRHIDRLQNGKCTIQLGFVLNDLLTNFERVSDHCSNIAVAVIERRNASIDPHAYLEEIKTGGSFTQDFRTNLKKYTLPQA